MLHFEPFSEIWDVVKRDERRKLTFIVVQRVANGQQITFSWNLAFWKTKCSWTWTCFSFSSFLLAAQISSYKYTRDKQLASNEWINLATKHEKCFRIWEILEAFYLKSLARFAALWCSKRKRKNIQKKIQPLKFIASDFFAIKIYRKTKNTLELNLVFLSLLSAMRRAK